MTPKLRMGATLVAGGLCLALAACGSQPAAGGISSPPAATTAASAPSAEAPASARPVEETASSRTAAASVRVRYMRDRQFWDIVERSLEASQGSAERQAAELEEILAGLPLAMIASFDATFTAKTEALYTWETWGAVYVLLEYCADDCFDYFRNWVVGQGRDYYAAVYRDPLALGDGRLADDAEAGDAELLDYASGDAYARASGGRDLYEDYPDNPVSLTGAEAPAGDKRWDDDDVADFYPGLEPIPLNW